jgi:glycosyltransferase involved in cell wall biosynthesis
MKWICCQLGAREHYAIPRALFRLGMLEYLLTDAWVPPVSLVAMLGRGQKSDISSRWQEELSDTRVVAFNSSLLMFELLARVRGLTGWPKIIQRNRWFQRKVVNILSSLAAEASAKAADLRPLTSDAPALLSYSYTALEPFRYAKANGWKTVLLQIDPGPEEEAIVAEEAARVPELAGSWQPAPPEYWDSWQEECNLADRIVVNSEWSREGLVRGGVAAEKISIIPLAYEAPEIRRLRIATARQESQKPAAFAEALAAKEVRSSRSYPARFTEERPLRVLFLGLINLRKGVARLLEAARILYNEPVEFWMVGPVEIANAAAIRDAKRVKWFGPVTRKQTTEYYRNADVFILPTLSDGFAITQLEAQAHGLPVITSKFCGKVVENDVNGIVLEEPSAACIAQVVRFCIVNPGRLEELASSSSVPDKFTIQALAHQMLDLAGTL